MSESLELGGQARRFVRAHPGGVLSTLSRRFDGAPFGSVCPFVLDDDGSPVFLISDLAEHTRNLAADPRCSLIAHPCAADMQSSGRVTLIGRAERVEQRDQLAPRYLRHLPEAAQFLALGDFHFHRLRVEAVRFIAGFGAIRWIPAESFAPPANAVGEAEEALLERLAASHTATLAQAAAARCCTVPKRLEIVGVDCDGIDLRVDDAPLRVDFAAPVLEPAGVEAALLALTQAA